MLLQTCLEQYTYTLVLVRCQCPPSQTPIVQMQLIFHVGTVIEKKNLKPIEVMDQVKYMDQPQRQGPLQRMT